MIKAPTRFRRFCARSSRTGPRVYCGEPPAGVTRVRADAGQANRGGRVVGRAGGPARPGPPAMPHPVRALTLTFLGCPAAAPPRASSSRRRSRGRSRRSRSSNHRGVGDFHHPGLLASRLSALWVEGPTRRSTDLSFRASPAWRAHFLYQWRVEPGTRTAPILGHRVVHVRWYPARFLKFCCRHGGEPHLPATGKTLRSRVGHDLGGVGGGGMPPPVTLAAPAELS